MSNLPPLIPVGSTSTPNSSGQQSTVLPSSGVRSNNPFTPGRLPGHRLAPSLNINAGSPLPVRDAAAIYAADLTRPSITTRTVSGTGWATGLELVFTEHNWGKWYEQLDMTLGISAMTGYIDGRIAIPSANLEPRALNAYRDNDGGILAFIRQKIDATERGHIKACTTSRDAISILRNRHLNRGPQAQVLILTELLGTHFQGELTNIMNNRDLVS